MKGVIGMQQTTSVRITINGQRTESSAGGDLVLHTEDEVIVISAEQLRKYGENQARVAKVTAFLIGLGAALFH